MSLQVRLQHAFFALVLLLTACQPAVSAFRATPRPSLATAVAPGASPSPVVSAASPQPSATPLATTPPAPRLTSKPPAYRSFATRWPEAALVFDRAMDPASVAAALSVEPPVDLELSWEGATLTARPAQPLAPGQTYRFTLGPGTVDTLGQPLAQAYTWEYSLRPLVGSLVVPTRANRRQTISLRFNYGLDSASLSAAFRLTPAVAGDVAVTDLGQRLTFTPAVSLTTNTVYSVTFASGLLDLDGQPIAPPAPLTFTTPPPVLAHGPTAQANVSPAAAIQITFDRLMDQASTQAALSLDPAVPGAFLWNETTLTFAPETLLVPHTRYTVTLDAGARAAGAAGPLLTLPFQWSFTTGELRAVASFGMGPNAQVLDAAGRRALQIVYQQPTAAALHFDLYALSTEQFLDRYSSGFSSDPYAEERPLSTAGATLVRSWEVVDPPLHRNDYGGPVAEVVVPPDVPPGLYVLDLRAGALNDQLILVLSHNVLAVKQAEGQLVAWVTNALDRPVPGAAVAVYARDGALIAAGEADALGVFRTAVARDPQPLIVIAAEGDDRTVAGLSNEWRTGGYGWYDWWQPAPVTDKYAAFIYTDRPIYRPGQTVYFKAILRHDADADLRVPAEGTPVTVRVRDARNNVAQTLALQTQGFGTVHGRFELAEGAMLGDYALEAEIGGESHRQVFKVQDYRKPDYTVTVQPDAAHYVTGDRITLSVDARYFFDQPVAGAGLVLRQYELAPDYGCWEGCTNSPDRWINLGLPEQHARSDAAGRHTFSLSAQPGQLGYGWQTDAPTRWGLEVTADDGSGQSVTGFAVVEVYPAAERVELDTGHFLHAPGRPFAVTARVRNLAGQPVAGRALELQLRRWESRSYDYTDVVQAQALVTGPDGQARLDLVVPEPGYYQAHLTGGDARGNALQADTWLLIFAEGAGWAGQYSGDLRVSADKDRYAPGETATLLVESTFSGPALLTFERGTTRREQLADLVAPVTRLAVPIEAGDAPNIFVTVNAWKAQDTSLAAHAGNPYLYLSLPDAQLRTASVELNVPVAGKRLNVELAPGKPVYGPREQAAFTVRVTDERGEPVSAEVSLALVDEAIFSLSQPLSGPIFDAFYFQRGNLVRTYDSYALLRWLMDQGGRGGGGGDGAALANPRSDFPDTAAWIPAVHTDWQGQAEVTLTLPDSLTTWRLTAVAVTADTQVGEAHTTIVTQQPITIRPLLPRSLTAGDQVLLSAMVRNDGDGAHDLLVWLDAPLLSLAAPATQTLRLAPGEQRMVGWPATAGEAGTAEITLRAVAADDGLAGDAIRVPLPIQPLAIPAVTTQVGDFTGEFNTTIDLPAGALPQSTVRVELSRSIAGTLLTGLEYLTGFPYGCVEQTMSRALPNAVVGRALNRLGVGDPTLQADLPPKILASIQRLYGFQHNDGGWGWWFDDATDDYQTAWVVFGLAVTAQAGYEVDPGVVERGAEWLAQHLDGMDLRTRAFALYSLAVAGHGDLAASLSLARQAERLDAFSQAGLALALHSLGAAAEAQQLLDVLAASAVVQDGKAYWPTGQADGHYSQKTMASATRSTALGLSAFVAIRPSDPLEPSLVRYLMSQRRQEGWGSTNETSFAILALTDHLLARESATTDTAYQVEVNGQVLSSGTLGRGEPAVSVEIPASALQPGTNALRLTQSGGGRLYYVVGSRVYVAQPAIEAAGRLQVSRAYLDPATGQPFTGSVSAGQLVKVQVAVTFSDNAFYVLVEDHLPGGLEALNERLNTTSHETTAYEWEPQTFYWEVYGYNNKEVFGDRVSFFVSETGAGRRVYTYYARAVRAGVFSALPAEASAMYDLTVWGRSASSSLTIDAAP